MTAKPVVGRFAPTPSGRMHLGNVFAAMLAWLSVRSRNGSLVLRMEDLDTQRTSDEYARVLREDLLWLGLDWDVETPPQSQRSPVYDRYFDILREKALLYPWADGVYVYQLAVTVDDGKAGVTEVVRGMDLLSSAPRQMYLQELFGFEHPVYAHVPMLVAPDGRRLSKRDKDLDLGELRKYVKAEKLLGVLAFSAGLTATAQPVSARELASVFSWGRISGDAICLNTQDLYG